jgi:hypothetical protein
MPSDSNTNKPYLTEAQYEALFERIAALRETVAKRQAGDLTQNPALADALVAQVDSLLQTVLDADRVASVPPDKGLAELVGVGPEAAERLGQTRLPAAVEPYDETVTSERIIAIADLYYIYQHERIGVFRVVRRLQELFRAGTLRLSSGQGAYWLYQFDRRQVLRYTRRDRRVAYRRVLGYGTAPVPPGSRPNTDFHRLLTHFMNEVAAYWRDKRISDVIRERAYDPSFGSVAIVRRAGLDLRNNGKFTSFGNLSVLRVEVMQLLDEAFRILNQDDIKRLFGADNAWDVIEEVLVRYFNEQLVTSPRQRMAVSGREVLRWLASPHILQTQRPQFEALLLEIAEHAEEWLTSAQSLGQARPVTPGRVLSTLTRVPVGPAAARPNGQRQPARNP